MPDRTVEDILQDRRIAAMDSRLDTVANELNKDMQEIRNRLKVLETVPTTFWGLVWKTLFRS